MTPNNLITEALCQNHPKPVRDDEQQAGLDPNGTQLEAY